MDNLNVAAIDASFNRHLQSQTLATASHSQTLEGLILAQAVEDPNVIGQMQSAFNNFVETGQIWALIIGLVIGYGFRSLLPS
jgi:hypothetical protein